MTIVEKHSTGINFICSVEVCIECPRDRFSDVVHLEDLRDNVLSRNSVLIVENHLNELGFIKAILKSRKDRKLIHKINKYWEVKSIGGCGQIPDLINETVSSLDSKRISVFNDSDRMYPTQKIGTAQSNIINACRINNVKHVTLRKREVENYITDDLLVQLGKLSGKKLHAWQSLNNSQKSFFDYKIGFTKKPHNHASYGGLYNHICSDVIEELKDGFGKHIMEQAFSEENFSFYEENKLLQFCANANFDFKSIYKNLLETL